MKNSRRRTGANGDGGLQLIEHNMDLILTVIRYQNLPPYDATRVTLGAAGGTIGRGADNDLVLPDPDRWVSGQHAKIRFRNGTFFLTDTSKNGTYINHAAEPLRQGQEVELHEGDELSIGAYEVRTTLTDAQAQPACTFDPFAAGEPSDDLFGAPPAGGAAPDILNLVGPPSAGREPPPLSAPESEATPAADTWSAPEPPVKDWTFGTTPESEAAPPPPSEPDHTPDERAFFSPPNAIPEHYDIWADEAHPAPGAMESATAETGAEAAPPSSRPSPGGPRRSPRPPTAAEIPTIPPAQAAPAEQAHLAAFLAGLGQGLVAADPSAQIELMQTAGRLLRTMIEGLMRVMMARASFKSELRLEMTTIRARENNPFKFSVDPDDALDHLLFRPTRGFLPPIEAAREAFDDIQSHEMAIIAGLRAALRALLARLDPAELEQRFRDRSVLDNLMPMARKAKCWDLFTETYSEVAADAAEDFLHLFGDAFTRAYEDQAYRLRQSRGQKGPSEER